MNMISTRGPTLALCASLATLSLACGETQPTFSPPKALIEPAALDFSAVSVQSAKLMSVTVKSTGGQGYQISAHTLTGAGASAFEVTIPETLKKGLRPGAKETIQVNYRPCPAAWKNGELDTSFDFATCENKPHSAELVLVDNSGKAVPPIVLSGEPAQPPKAGVSCGAPPPAGQTWCGQEPSATTNHCINLNFGSVKGGEPACDLWVDITNTADSARRGDLIVERAEVLVRRNNEQLKGEDVGFEILDASQKPVSFPIHVPLPAGELLGKKRLYVRFKGTVAGSFFGGKTRQEGLRLYTNDPNHKILTVSLAAEGSAPNLSIYPQSIDFGPIKVGEKKTLDVSLSNQGNADLTVSTIDGDNDEFSWELAGSASVPLTLAPTESQELRITYAPKNTGLDVSELRLSSNDPAYPVSKLHMRGGPVPRIEVSPASTLEIPAGQGESTFQVANQGYGDLVITGFDLKDTNEGASVDDFRIEDCTAMPCQVSYTLCSPYAEGCTTSRKDIRVFYKNNDISIVDVADLTISSNDPENANYLLTLKANDVPCLYPTPAITVLTQKACLGKPVELKAEGNPGGEAGGASATITKYDWQISWPTGEGPISAGSTPDVGQYIPKQDGLHIINLYTENSCGARSQKAVTTQVTVTRDCE